MRSYALWCFELVEPHGLSPPLLPFFLAPFVFLFSRDDDNLCSLGFNLLKSLARDRGLRIEYTGEKVKPYTISVG